MIVVVAVILAGLIATTPGVGDLIGSGLRRASLLIPGRAPKLFSGAGDGRR